MQRNHLIVIAGPTASGKTSLAVEVAQKFNTSIISFDSRQCYQELSIGTAKPSKEEQSGVKHYFIDDQSIHHPVTAYDFEQYALRVLHDQFQKNNIVVAVGGTGLYLKAILDGLDEMPSVPDEVNQEVINLYQNNGIEALQESIKNFDPDFYQRGEINNPHRLIRALAFTKAHGQSILQYRKHIKKERDFLCHLFIIDWQRDELYERINKRVDLMIDAGLVDEVQSLLAVQHLLPLQTVGYQELFEYFNGQCTLDYAVDKIKQHTRNYAKRQITWFKKMDHSSWGDHSTILDQIAQLDLK